MTKTSNKNVNEEIANMSFGIGVRGFGDISGTPATDEDSENSHIERVVTSANEYRDLVRNFIQSHPTTTTSLLQEPDDNWWAKPGAKGSSLTAMGKPMKSSKTIKEESNKDHYAALDDVHVNLDNRNHAIEDYGYGPLNPKQPSKDFWKKKADLWETSVDEAMKSRCGNCAAFNQSRDILNRIADGLGPVGGVITEKADLGFCEMFEFKCAASRTCDAWLVNGPITEQEGGGAPANAVGGGNIAGLGVGPKGEPGVPKSRQPRFRRNKKRLIPTRRILQSPLFETGTFAGEQTFVVPTDIFESIKAERPNYNKYLNENTLCFSIREYAYANPDSPLILEDEKTGNVVFLRYGKKNKGE